MDQQDFRALLSKKDSSTKDIRSKRVKLTDHGQQFHSSATILPPRRVKAGITRDDINARNGSCSNSSRRQRERSEKSLLPSNYTDRVKERSLGNSTQDDRQREIDRLKDQLKRKEISQREYVDRIQELSAGDVESSGMVRGLDRKLLARVKAGEDVFEKPEEVTKKAELELDTLLFQTQQKRTESQSARTGAADVATRDSILATIQEKTMKDANAVPTRQTAIESDLGSKFKRPRTMNPDGTTTESYEENGQKIKLIRDASGKIIKRLVKKHKKPAAATEPVVAAKPQDTAVAVPNQEESMPESSRGEPQSDADSDIFAGVGEYDPFSAPTPDTTATNAATNMGTEHRKYFGDSNSPEPHSGSEMTKKKNPKTFLKDHEGLLAEAEQNLLAKQKTKTTTKAIGKREDAGFGLVFDDDAYATDLRQTLDEDEDDVEEK